MDRSISSEVLGFYENFDPRDSMKDFERGREDGSREFPETNRMDFSPYEETLIGQARSALNTYTRRMKVVADDLQERVRRLTNERDVDYQSRKHALQSKKSAEIRELKEKEGTDSQVYRDLRDEAYHAEREFRAEQHDHGRSPRMRMHEPLFTKTSWLSWLNLYVLFLIGLAFLEVQINKEVLDAYFAFDLEAVSYIIAILIGVVLVIFAHFAGVQLKRATNPDENNRLIRFMLAAANLLLAGVVVYLIYEMRIGYVAADQLSPTVSSNLLGSPDLLGAIGQTANDLATNGQSNALVDLGASFLNNIFSQSVPESAGLDNTSKHQLLEGIALLVLNLLVLLIGTILSYIRHDPSPVLEAAYAMMVKKNISFVRADHAYKAKAATLERDILRRMTALQRETEQIDQDILNLNEQHIQVKRQLAADAKLVLNVLVQQLGAYQDGNQTARNSSCPTYFGQAGLAQIGKKIVVE